MINKDNVKEIVLETKYILSVYMPGFYTDKLVVTENSISYSRVGFMDNSLKIDWNYSMESSLYQSKYLDLLEAIDKVFNPEEITFPQILDAGYFTIWIHTNDGNSYEIQGASYLQFSGYADVASAFLSLIPFGEEYPEFINLKPINCGINRYVTRAVELFEKMKPHQETTVEYLLKQVNYPKDITLDIYNQFRILCNRKHIQMKYPFYKQNVDMPWKLIFHR